MDNEALVRALRKFEQQNESLKKVFSFSQWPFGNDVSDGIFSFQTSVEQKV